VRKVNVSWGLAGDEGQIKTEAHAQGKAEAQEETRKIQVEILRLASRAQVFVVVIFLL